METDAGDASYFGALEGFALREEGREGGKEGGGEGRVEGEREFKFRHACSCSEEVREEVREGGREGGGPAELLPYLQHHVDL